MKLFYKYINGDSELLLSSLGECFYGILYDTTFFLFTNVHDAKIETVGRLFVIK